MEQLRKIKDTGMDVFHSGVEGLHELNPDYAHKKESAQDKVDWAYWISVAGLITTVCLALLGVALLATGNTGAGVFIFMVTLPAFYLSYNNYTISANFRELLENPSRYRVGYLLPIFDRKHVREKISQGTFLAGWIVELYLGHAEDRGAFGPHLRNGSQAL